MFDADDERQISEMRRHAVISRCMKSMKQGSRTVAKRRQSHANRMASTFRSAGRRGRRRQRGTCGNRAHRGERGFQGIRRVEESGEGRSADRRARTAHASRPRRDARVTMRTRNRRLREAPGSRPQTPAARPPDGRTPSLSPEQPPDALPHSTCGVADTARETLDADTQGLGHPGADAPR